MCTLIGFLIIEPATANVINDTSKKSPFLTANNAFNVTYKVINNSIYVTIIIAPKYYLYKDKISIFVGFNKSPITLPQGENHVDDYFGQQEIYRQRVSFKIEINEQIHLNEMTLHYQGSSDLGLCYSPKTRLLATLNQDQLGTS